MKLAQPPELLENPELAALELLDTAVQQTVYALFAAHPQLVGGELEYAHDIDLEAWLADAIYNQGTALQYAIMRYREAILRRKSLSKHDDQF